MVDRVSRLIVPTEHTDDREHRRLLATRANAAFPKDGTEGMTAPLRLGSYATADLPDAALYPDAIAYDSTLDAVVFSDGATWEALSTADALDAVDAAWQAAIAALPAYSTSTWSPAIQGSGGNPTVTYTTQSGKYTQLGNVVWFSLHIVINAYSGGSGTARITLPSTVAGIDTACACVTSGVAWGTSDTTVVGVPQTGAAYLILTSLQINAASANLATSDLATTDVIRVSGHYYTS